MWQNHHVRRESRVRQGKPVNRAVPITAQSPALMLPRLRLRFPMRRRQRRKPNRSSHLPRTNLLYLNPSHLNPSHQNQ